MNRLPLHVFTLALDAMPWLACTFAELNKLEDVSWSWVVVEGAAAAVKDTAWCAKQGARLSADGTTEFLDAISHHPRVKVLRRPLWDGKVEMCNAALGCFTQPGVLLQVDGDELWEASQLRQIVELFEDDAGLGRLAFDCRYFVGPNLVLTDSVDWWRAWRFQAGDTFRTHEPPVMDVSWGRPEGRHWTRRLGLTFQHHSWTLPKHVAQKGKFYGKKYATALQGWERLQRHTRFPTPIKPFFPWSAPSTLVDQVFRCTC